MFKLIVGTIGVQDVPNVQIVQAVQIREAVPDVPSLRFVPVVPSEFGLDCKVSSRPSTSDTIHGGQPSWWSFNLNFAGLPAALTAIHYSHIVRGRYFT
jgi:hypothetical protein